jgi:hypothetical protein
MWYVEWKERFTASILMIILFAVLLFFLVPRQPTVIDVMYMLAGIVGGILHSVYLIKRIPSVLNQSPAQFAHAQRKGAIWGAILLVPVIVGTIWFGKVFIMSTSLFLFPGALILGISLTLYHWRQRPRI